jgi:isopentenyl phosphate kinase
MKDGELIFVKLGGSLITDKARPYSARADVIDRLASEIHRARAAQELSVVVGHGGGSFPHVSAEKYQVHRGVTDQRSWEGFVKVHDDAVRLNAIVCDSLGRAGELAFPIQPSAICVARGGRIETCEARAIEALLRAGLVPVPYGDVCVDAEQGCCVTSTEEIFSALAVKLAPDRIILVGKVEGVLDADGQVVPSIRAADLSRLAASLERSDGVADVTGGMLHKVERALEFGVRTQIINGLEPGLLERALMGESDLGTVIEG